MQLLSCLHIALLNGGGIQKWIDGSAEHDFSEALPSHAMSWCNTLSFVPVKCVSRSIKMFCSQLCYMV